MKPHKFVGITLIGFVFFAAIVFAASYGVLGGGLGSSDSKDQKYWNECQIGVDENLFGNGLSLEEVSCSNTGKKCGSLFSILHTEGSVEVWDSDGRLASKDFQTSTFGGKADLTIQACSSDDSLKVKLYDESHNLIEEKSA